MSGEFPSEGRPSRDGRRRLKSVPLGPTRSDERHYPHGVEACIVIVSHDTRLKDIADRVLWLEDGAFRAMSDMAIDPVCGMSVEREGAPHFRTDGQTFFFCSDACRRDFAGDPAGYLRTPARAGAAPGAPGMGNRPTAGL